MVTKRKYIGYGITNNNGIATLDYDANGDSITPSGYLGHGNGVINLEAEMHDDSSVVSVPYSVLDCIVKDDGVTGGDNHSEVLGLSACTRGTIDSEGTPITATNQNNPTINFRNSSDIYIYPHTGFEIVFDVVSMDTALTCYVADSSTTSQGFTINNGFAVGHTVKIKYDGSKVQIWYDDTGSTSQNITFSSGVRVYLRKNGNAQSFSMKIKNIRGYPI